MRDRDRGRRLLDPSQTIDLSIEYGNPTCDGPLKQASFTVQLSDDSTVELSIDSAGMEWLDRLYTKECALRSINDIATMTYGPEFKRATVDRQLVLPGELILRRPTDGDDEQSLTVRSLGGASWCAWSPTLPMSCRRS